MNLSKAIAPDFIRMNISTYEEGQWRFCFDDSVVLMATPEMMGVVKALIAVLKQVRDDEVLDVEETWNHFQCVLAK